MATITPVAFYTGSTIPGTTKVGNLSIGTTPQDYGVVGNNNGIVYYSTPDLGLGYVIAHEDSLAGHNGKPGNIPAKVGFWRSDNLTENSFVDLANYIANQDNSPQNFTGGTEAKLWLNTNGYWTSYVDTWSFNNGVTLSWPGSSSGYTLYNGGVTSFDDGYTNVAIKSFEPFEMDNQGLSNNIYVSTNGYITIGSGSSNIVNTPQNQPNPAAIAANPSDNWLQPGLTNTDGDVQNIYYLTGGTTGKSYIKFLVYAGTYNATTNPTSWLLNLYVDGTYQWVETRIKSNVRGNAGPYNSSDVSQSSSTTSRVWRGDLNGQNWTYMGTGSIN